MTTEHSAPPFNIPETYLTKHLGFRTESPEPGHTVVSHELQPHHLNITGAVHGGFLMTVLDTLMGHAVFTYLGDPAVRFATSSMTTHFLEAVSGGTLSGEGRVVARNEQYATAEAHPKDGEGRLVATAEAVFTFRRKGS